MDQEKDWTFLKNLGKEKDITQEQLAEKIKVSGRTVSRWETGFPPDKDTTPFTLTLLNRYSRRVDNKKGGMRPVEGAAYRLSLGFKGGNALFGTRLCGAKCSVLYALSALPLKMPLPLGRAWAF